MHEYERVLTLTGHYIILDPTTMTTPVHGILRGLSRGRGHATLYRANFKCSLKVSLPLKQEVRGTGLMIRSY